MSTIIHINYSGNSFDFMEDGWFNATLAAEKFGKRPVDWLALDSTKEYIESLCEILRSEKSSLLKVKRGGRGKSDATWMHPKLAVPFSRWLDVKFAIWCDIQIDDLMRGKHQYHDWKQLRHEAAASYKVLCNILKMTRERVGKTSAPHVFSNEARLINWVLTEEFGQLDRTALETADLDLLTRLEQMDTVLIGCGIDYEGRKKELKDYAEQQRSSTLTDNRC